MAVGLQKSNSMQVLRIIFSLWLLVIGWNVAIPEATAVESCSAIFSLANEVKFNRFHQREYKESALQIMMEGSLNVSRTRVLGRRFMAPAEVKDAQIAELAEANFRRAAEYIIENFESLEMNLQTAVILNKILTRLIDGMNMRRIVIQKLNVDCNAVKITYLWHFKSPWQQSRLSNR